MSDKVITAAPKVLSEAIEVTNSVVVISNELNIEGACQVIGSTISAISPFMPLIDVATALISKIIEIYKQAECNKKIIGALYNRAKLAEYSIETLQQRKKLHEKDFKTQEWYDAFNRFVYVLKEIRIFSEELSSIRGIQKYLKSYSIKDKFENIANDYDNVMKDLNFTMAVANEEQRRYDNECLMDEFAEMKKFVQTIDCGIETVIEEIRHMKSEQGQSTKPKEIEQRELTDPPHKEDSDYRGNNKQVFRRLYKNCEEVACKRFELNKKDEEYESKQRQLAILSKLSECANIIKFFGLSNYDGKQYMIEEWAYYGNLKETYEKYDIPWTRKLHIATDICRAIVFLQSVQVYHHDIRCENVMLTKCYVPKLANFECARTTKDGTISINNLSKIVHWLAPEKMFNKDVRYDAKCEIFSFGMLLWELTFEKVPYQGWESIKVEDHVKGGKREKITFGHVVNERELKIQKLLEKVIKEAWQQKPEDRILLINLFNELGQLQSKYKNVLELPLLPPKTLDLDGLAQSEISDVNILPECKDLIFDFEIETVISFEEGIKAHNSEKYKEAWKCFEYHAKNGNLYAKYWKGYYLMDGRYVEKNIEEAAKLFKETADKGLSDAQLRYAYTLQNKINKDVEREEFIKYLIMSADGGNKIAQFNIGRAYLNEGLNLDNEKKGIHYLKLAALQNHTDAIKLLEEKKIEFIKP